MGWQLDEPWMGTLRSRSAFGKTGFTGTSCLCDLEQGTGIVLLSNYTFPTRKKDATAINAARADVADIVFSRSS